MVGIWQSLGLDVVRCLRACSAGVENKHELVTRHAVSRESAIRRNAIQAGCTSGLARHLDGTHALVVGIVYSDIYRGARW